MMNNIFDQEIGGKLEVFIDDMIVKFIEEQLHEIHLNSVFNVYANII